MLANVLRALLRDPSDHNWDWAAAALDRYDHDAGDKAPPDSYEDYRRNWPDSDATDVRR